MRVRTNRAGRVGERAGVGGVTNKSGEEAAETGPDGENFRRNTEGVATGLWFAG